jgi:cold shock CspA family protein
VQGVIKSYDPGTGDGVVMRDTDLSELDLARGALEGSVFRMLRQGQRVVFDLDTEGRATALRLGSEVDMGTPGFPRADANPTLAAEPTGSLPEPTTPDSTPTKVADDPSS